MTNRTNIIEKIKEIISATDGPVVIQAGHFALVQNPETNTLVPGIYQQIADKDLAAQVRQHPYMGDFPLATWSAGVELAAYAHKIRRGARLAIFVNDWQWVPPVATGAPNTTRDDFFQHSTLPPLYQHMLEQNGLGLPTLLPFYSREGKINHPIFFKETRLRAQYARQNLNTVCQLNNQCAQEMIPFLQQLHKRGTTKLLVNFVPKTCMLAVKAGCKTAQEVLGIDIKVINVFPGAVDPEKFWEHAIVSE